jgi:hypothetical protein
VQRESSSSPCRTVAGSWPGNQRGAAENFLLICESETIDRKQKKAALRPPFNFIFLLTGKLPATS